jgi:hypothetical protein
MRRRSTRAVLRLAVEALEQRLFLTATAGSTGKASVAVAASKLPGSVVAGAPMHGSVTVDLTNSGATTERGAFKIDLFATPDGSLDGSQTLVKSVKRISSIRAGRTLAATIHLNSLPPTLGDGSYTLLAEVIDKDGNTSVSPTGPVIQVTAPHLAFSEQLLKVSLPASLTSGAPTHGTATIRITNNGNTASTGVSTIELVASSDGTADTGALATVNRNLSIQGNGGSTVVAVPVKQIPAGLNGSYQVVAQVTDPQQNVTSASAKSSLNVKPAKNVSTPASSPAATSSATQDSIQPATSSNSITLGQQPGAPNNLQFHGDAARSGFNQNETFLTPSNVASGFGQIWESPVLDGAVYATPLYEDSVLIQGNGNAANHAGDGVQSSTFQGQTLGVVFAATGGGSLYCIAAENTDGTTPIAPGTILWKTHLGNPYAGVDGNSIGVLGTPIIDPASGRIYVAASVTDYLSSASNPNHGGSNFEVFALSIHDGSLISGFPLIYTQTLLDSINQNTLQGPGIAVPFSSSGADQRGALNLNADGSTLYVDFACYGASNPGWMTTVATGMSNGVSDGQTPAIVSAYSSVDTTAVNANGGMWGAGGPAIDSSGNVFVTTGDSPSNTGNPNGDWGDSVLEFGPGQTLALTGVYTPWNYLNQDTIDSDMGGGSPILVTLPAGSATATELLATGGKQGNGYLADAGNHLNDPTANASGSPAQYPASLTARPPGTESPSQDASLYSPANQTYWTTNNQGQSIGPQPGPLALFGPYNESSASGNTAKARDTPATFTGPDGTQYVIWAGATKASVGSSTPVAPSLITTRVVTSPGQAPYLQIVSENNQVMSNPGSNLITGNGTSNEIDWVVDEGVQRTDALNNGFTNGAPVLYAYNAITMQPIWSSSYGQLDMGGKYNSIAVARGNLYVGTNRIQAFGLTTDTIVDDSATGTGLNKFTYQGSGWQHLTGGSTMGTFDSTISTDNVQGDSATLQFTGSAITVYSNEVSTYGTATISVDSGNTQNVTLTPTYSSPNGDGSGDVAVYTVTGLGPGTHTLKILNNSASITISVDRVEITPLASSPAQIGVSLTDGNVIPQAQGVIPYTINYNNLGGIQTTTNIGTGSGTASGIVAATTGTNAAGVVVTETVPVNTTADLANSTPGWTLQSAGSGGAGSAGSTYSFSVGALNAGLTGSVVFSVDLNASIPVGTTSVTDNVRITDAASDQSSSSRNTPIPPPQESKLIFQSEPPAQGSADLPLTPAFTVAVEDQFGNVYTADSSSTVTLTLNNGTINSGATAQVTNGIATFNSVVIDTAGNYTLTASDGGLTSANSSSFVIENSSKLAIGQQPSQTVAGKAVNPAVTVDVENSSGQIINNDQSLVTLTLNTGQFSNGSTSMTVNAVNGVATFSNLVIDSTGSYTLIASDSLLQQTQTNPFSVVAVGSQLAFTQQPATAIVNSAINPSVAISVEDAFGNVDTSNASNVAVTLSGGPGTFFGGATSATVTCVNGVASFNDLVVTAAGTYTLTAVDSNNTISSATSMSFTVGTHALTSIDDNNANNTGGIPQVSYAAPAHWVQTPTSVPNNFDGTVTTDSTGGDTATVTFNATLITLYALTSPTAGSAQIFIDGNNPTQVNLSAPTTSIQPIFTSSLLSAGSHTIVVKVVSGSVAIDRFVVGPATPTLVWATPATLTYDTALDGTELDAFVSNFANFPGTFTYIPAAGTILPVGNNQVLSVSFAPNDSTDYISSSAQVHINVVKATPVITWTGPDTDMTFGQALGPNQLDATATINGTTVPGTFVYTPGAGTMPPTGDNFQLNLTFTPNDTTDFNATTANQNVDVDPANPLITWPKPADITDGQPLTSTQLDATANVPGTFVYTPAAGTVLPPGQGQSLGVVFTPSDSTDYNLVGASALINVDYGAPSQLAFTQQPANTMAAASITPPIAVAVEDSAGSIIPNNNSLVTLTLSSGAFDGGSTTVSAVAVNGVATFGDVAIDTTGTYTLTASAASPITSATSTTFSVYTPLSLNLNFNPSSSTFTNNFTVANASSGANATIAWGSTLGVNDQSGGAAGGGVQSTDNNSTIDWTMDYTPPAPNPSTVNLSDGLVHTISEFYNVSTYTGIGSGDKPLQLGFLAPGFTEFNANNAFVSARVLGNKTVEFQSDNGAGQGAVSNYNTTPTGTINAGDWVQLIFNTRETASGSFTGTFEEIDYVRTGHIGNSSVQPHR